MPTLHVRRDRDDRAPARARHFGTVLAEFWEREREGTRGGLVGGHWSGKFASIPSLAVTPLRSWARGSQEAGLTQPRAHFFALVWTTD